MDRAAFIAGSILTAACGGGPTLAATAVAPARVVIIEGNVVRINWSLAMPSVRSSGEGAAFVGGRTSLTTMTGVITPRDRLAVLPDDGDTPPVTAPASFEVVSRRGQDAVIVRTAADTEVRIAEDGVIVDGALQGASAASIQVGNSAAARGRTLTVVVQYN